MKTEQLRFDGRVALVTGAGKGLGSAYAEWLAARGARVVVNNRRQAGQPSSAQAVATRICAAGGTALAVDGAVESAADAQAMVETALKTWGRLDILICNAGISPGGSFHKMDPALFREVVDVNLFGTVLPLRAALPAMREAGYGRVVVTTSASAYCGAFGLSAYAAAKAAVIGLLRTLTIENATQDIHFNAISPFAHTPMTEPFMRDDHKPQMRPEQIAPVVGWLASAACPDSGSIVEAGAGRLRRVRFGVGPLAELDAEDIESLWARLAGIDRVRELGSAQIAGDEILAGEDRPAEP